MSFQPNESGGAPGSGDQFPQVDRRRRDRRQYSVVQPRIQGEISIADLWTLLIKRRNTFSVCLTLVLLLSVAVSMLLPERYEGSAQLTLDFDSNALQDAVSAVSGGVDADDLKLQTQVKVLETDALAWNVIKRLRLDQKPDAALHSFVIGPAKCLSGPNQRFESIGLECRTLMLREFHRRLRVEALTRTQIIQIRYRSKSPALAAEVVNTLVDEYTETSFQRKYNSAVRASKWVSGQLSEAKESAHKAEERYIDYQKKSGIIGTDENHNVLIERLNAINQQLVVVEATRIVREARYRVSLEGDPEALVELTPGSTLQVLHAQQVALKNQYAQLTEKFDEAYPRVKQLKAQLDESTTALNAEIVRSSAKIKSEYDSALQSETLLRKEFEEQKQQAYDTSESTIELALLKRDVDASRDLYEQLVKQLNEAGVLAGLRATHVTVIDPANPPIEPVEPHYGLNFAVGLIGGSVIGIVICFLQENTDTTILTPQDVARVSTLPVLGVVPRYMVAKPQGRNSIYSDGERFAVLEKPEGVVADAYRSLRTALLLSNAGVPPKIIVVTSARPSEGKTTTSINLAAVFAQKQRRVLLVGGDLRKGDLRKYFGIEQRGGLSAALAGEDPEQFYIAHPDLPNLFILPAGQRPPKPPDLLDSDRMRALIAIWRTSFDHVVIDTPPILGLSDAVILTTQGDATVLVIKAKVSRRQDFQLALEILGGVRANLSGVIINDFQESSSGYGYDSKLYGSYFEERSGGGNV